MSASERGGIGRVLVMTILAVVLAAFLGLIVDAVVPMPTDPYSAEATQGPSAAQAEEFQKRRDAVDTRLSNGEITEDEANTLWTQIDDEESVFFGAPGDADYAEYEAASRTRSQLVAFIDIGLVVLLWGVAVLMHRLGAGLAAVPLLGGGFFGVWAAVQTVGVAPDRWVMVSVTGVLALTAIAVGGLTFGFMRPRETA
jgi:Flp pilus assembly protein TadB